MLGQFEKVAKAAIVAVVGFGSAVADDAGFELRVFADGEGSTQVVRSLAELAPELGLEFVETGDNPAMPSEVVVLYGGTPVGYRIALEIADHLRDFGVRASILGEGLGEYLLPAKSVTVFLGLGFGEDSGAELSDRGAVRGLLCARTEGHAVVMLFSRHDLEMQIYRFIGEEVLGETHYGTWQVRDGMVVLSPSLRDELRYRPSAQCLSTGPDLDQSCSGTLQWQSGGSIPTLEGCDLTVQDLVFEE